MLNCYPEQIIFKNESLLKIIRAMKNLTIIL